MSDKKYTTYTYKGFKGNVGDLVTEWMTAEETEKFWKEHKKRIAKLKEEGGYLKPFEINIKMEHDPLYDSKIESSNASESYSFDILDLTKIENIESFETTKEHLDAWKKYNPNNDIYGK